MANIYELLEQIETAIYGRDVRSSIHDSIEQCYKDATGNPDSLSAIIEKLFNGSTAKLGIGNYVSNDEIEFSEISHGAETDISSASVYLSPGLWLVDINLRVQPVSEDGRMILTTVQDYIVDDHITYYSIPAHEITYIRHFTIVPSNSILWQAVEPDGEHEGYALFPMTVYSGVDLNFVTVRVKAICIKSNSSEDSDESIEEQVIQNTADIAELKSRSFSIDSNEYLIVG